MLKAFPCQRLWLHFSHVKKLGWSNLIFQNLMKCQPLKLDGCCQALKPQKSKARWHFVLQIWVLGFDVTDQAVFDKTWLKLLFAFVCLLFVFLRF